MGTGSAAGIGFVEESCICVGAQDCVTRPIYDAVGRIGSHVVE